MTRSKKLRIGTRKSKLALTQSRLIQNALTNLGIESELIPIVSKGDKEKKSALYEIENSSPGLFTKQLEDALLENKVDIAVHSLKDLPTQQPESLQVIAIPKREKAEDCLIISKKAYKEKNPFGLKENAKVGTSSLRREAQLLSLRSDLKILPLRGNVPTRITAVKTGRLDGVVLAEAGLNRLGLTLEGLVRLPLPQSQFVSAPGQGALAIECRLDLDSEWANALKGLDDAETRRETAIERRILRVLEGGCTLPLGVRVIITGSQLSLHSFLGIAREPHQWLGFHRFDISEAEEDTLVRKTVDFFKEIQEGF